jgi:hypothetical protein
MDNFKELGSVIGMLEQALEHYRQSVEMYVKLRRSLHVV